MYYISIYEYVCMYYIYKHSNNIYVYIYIYIILILDIFICKGTFCPGWWCASHAAHPFVPVAKLGTKAPPPPPFCPGLTFPIGKPGQQGFSNRDKFAFL